MKLRYLFPLDVCWLLGFLLSKLMIIGQVVSRGDVVIILVDQISFFDVLGCERNSLDLVQDIIIFDIVNIF